MTIKECALLALGYVHVNLSLINSSMPWRPLLPPLSSPHWEGPVPISYDFV